MKYKFSIPDGDLGVSFQDAGPWRSFEVNDCAGNSIEECLKDLFVSEVDQDGGDLDQYGFDDAPSDVQQAIMTSLTDES